MPKNRFQDLPSHVAIIMDGNGRWAKHRAMPRFLGHRQGVKALKKAVRYASNQGITTLTVYAFSTENWQRPMEEVNFLMDLMYKTLVQEIEELQQEGVRIIQIGDKVSLAPEVRKMWEQVEQSTAHNTGLTLNIAFNYGGRQELLAAARELAKRASQGEITWDEITLESIYNLLYTAHSPDPDLIIRTGGEFRLSNFLLWQAAYAEIYVTDVLWPDFDEKDFSLALENFKRRERRFGQVLTKESDK